MKVAQNPILKGFNPDPSMIRVGEDYYIATSTFEWFPGIAIYHSRDLVNWRLIATPLNDNMYMNLTGIDSACGIWAPSLTYSNGVYYIVYTIVYTNRSRYKDTHNFLITAPSIYGPWSKPIFLNSSGFDPSLFHDDNGKKWLLNMTIDHRISKKRFSGIELQEFNIECQKLVGPIHKIFEGTSIGTTEAPNIIKYNDYYYLMCAEGGTEFGHCVTVARSKQLFGEYEVDPKNPLLTSKGHESYPIQRAGHGQLINTSQGDWYIVYLCSRPINNYSILGREVAIQNVEYTEDGWFKLKEGDGTLPQKEFYVEDYILNKSKVVIREDFNESIIPIEFMTLRNSAEQNKITTKERQGYLRIYGGNSLSSKYKQGLLARRQQSMNYNCTISMEFSPRSYRHMAGLVCYYNYDNYHYLNVSFDEDLNRCINIITCNNKKIIQTKNFSIPNEAKPCYLKAEVRGENLQFYYSQDGIQFEVIGDVLDMKILSDEHVEGNGFTGAMIGVCCQDLQGDGIYADFDWFEYKEINL